MERHRVLIALGSNYLPGAHMQWAAQRLQMIIDDSRFSPTLWTQDIHHTSVYYMNQLVWGTTDMPVDSLLALLKSMEAETQRKPGRVTIDLDLMQYDEQRFHLDDWSRLYIQRLL